MIEKGLNLYERFNYYKSKNNSAQLEAQLKEYIDAFGNLFIGGDLSLVENRAKALQKIASGSVEPSLIEAYSKFKYQITENTFDDLISEKTDIILNAVKTLDRYILQCFGNHPDINKSLSMLCQDVNSKKIIQDIAGQVSDFIKYIMLADTLFYEHKVLLENGYAEGVKENFHSYFINSITQQKDFLEYLFEKYPVLIPSMHKFIRNQEAYISKFLSELVADSEEIKIKFGVNVLHNLSALSLFNNALRNNNTHVVILEFEDGQKLLYKPKDFKTETFFKEVLEEISRAGLKINTRFPSGIDKGSYSWVEFINTKESSCKDEEEVKEFFYTQGQMLFIFYLFNSYDIGSGNILCAGHQPSYIDLEGLFSRRINFRDDEVLMKAIETKFDISVKHIGMLPKWSKEEDMAKGRMKSALTKTGQHNAHLPSLEGAVKSGENYLEDILNGFQTTYMFVRKNRESLKKFIVDKLSEKIYIRKILRSSSTYFTLQKQYFNPVNLTDGVKANLVYDHAWSAHEEEGYNENIIESEVRQLLNLDVPVYSVDLYSNKLFDGLLKEVSDIKFKSDIRNDLTEKFENLSDEDLEFQLNIINGSFTIFKEQNSLPS